MPAFSPNRRDTLAIFATCAAPWIAHAQTRRDSVLIALSLEPNSLDPTSAPASANAEVVHYNILQGLTKIEQDGKTSPLLAENWYTSADQQVWRFSLRRNVQFHDGSPFDASTVRWCFERAQQANSGNKGQNALFDNVSAIETPDPHTVVLQLHHPDPHLLFRLGESYAVILHPKTAATAHSQPIGTGPYRFERWQRGQSIHLERFTGYWGPAPALKRASFHFLDATQLEQKDFASNSIDLFFNFASPLLEPLRTQGAYQVLIGSSSSKGMLALNHRLPLFQDVRVRQALTHAIDREQFIQAVLEGHGTAIGSHFAPSEPGYLRLASAYPYDPERARQLLKEAGIKQPLQLPLSFPPTPYGRNGGPLIAKNLAAIGIQVEVQPLTWPQWLNGPFKGDFTMTLINHVEPLDYAIYANPDYYFGYNNPAYRNLLDRYQKGRTMRERQRLLTEIQRFLAKDAANIWIFNPSIGTVARTGLQGVWVNYPIFAHDIAAMRWTK